MGPQTHLILSQFFSSLKKKVFSESHQHRGIYIAHGQRKNQWKKLEFGAVERTKSLAHHFLNQRLIFYLGRLVRAQGIEETLRGIVGHLVPISVGIPYFTQVGG